MSYLDTELQFFENNIKKVCPIGTLTLKQWLYSIKFPKKEIVTLFEEIEKASSDKNLQLKAKLKGRLYYLTPASISDGKGRAYSNCVGYTGLAMLDFDQLEPEFAIEMKKFIFESYPYVIASFLSVSKRGLKVIVRIPIVETVEEYKAVYYGLLSEFEQFKGCDSAHSNAVLASYITYDRDLLYRTTATVFDRKGIRIDEFKVSNETLEELTDIDPKDVEGIKLMLQRMMAKIDVEQQGHGNVVHSALVLGGYVGMGYLPYDEAVSYLFELMDESLYLQKGIHGYKKTAVSMINRGLLAPLIYNKNKHLQSSI